MSTIDDIMAKIDEDPTLATKEDIDAIIAYQRQRRAQLEAGQKPKKAGADGPKVKIDLAALGLLKPKAAPVITPGKRRF